MLKTSVVRLSGRGSRVDLTIDDTAPFDEVARGLREYLAENRPLCSSGTITVNVGRRMLSREEMVQIRQILEEEADLTVARFWCGPDILEEAPSNGDGAWVGETPPRQLIHNQLQVDLTEAGKVSARQQKGREAPKQAGSSQGRGTEALFIKATCRSGEIIRHPGDIVVLGDINPGAEVIAGGDILVFGSLRGLAHAGAAGDIRAVIISLRLDTPWLAIGPHVAVASSTNQRPKFTEAEPRIAYVRRRSIHIARFAGHGRGMLYGR